MWTSTTVRRAILRMQHPIGLTALIREDPSGRVEDHLAERLGCAIRVPIFNDPICRCFFNDFGKSLNYPKRL